MKTNNISAQKTVKASQNGAFKTLKNYLARKYKITFLDTAKPNIKKAVLEDGTTLVVASFTKPNGAILAMIDHEQVAVSKDRHLIQKQWKQDITDAFAQ